MCMIIASNFANVNKYLSKNNKYLSFYILLQYILISRAAAVSRCNLRGRARKNNVFCFSRTNARLCGINSTAQTKTKIQIKKAVKQSLSFCNFANQQAKIINFIFRATMLFHRTYIQAVNLKQKPYLIKKKKAAKCRVNGVSGTLCGKTLFFPRFF